MNDTLRFAVGDPQAPLATLRAVLEHHGALGADGRLARNATLVSIGDHFDYGASSERREAAGKDSRSSDGWPPIPMTRSR